MSVARPSELEIQVLGVQLMARPLGNVSRVVVRPGDESSAPEVTLRGEVPDWHRSRSADQ